MDRKDQPMALRREPHVLVIGGTDSSGGAGLGRDIATIAALGVRTCLAVTAVTVQTHDALMAIHPVPPDCVADQMRAALVANEVAAIKIGMLASEQTIAAVAAVLRECPGIPAVLDPVLAASSGGSLLQTGTALKALKRDLIPLCDLVTPNLIELAMLADAASASNDDEIMRQGQGLLDSGARAVLVKGGHATGPLSTDILLCSSETPRRFDAPRLDKSMRGTGCMLASAIAGYLANASILEVSVRKGKQLVFEQLQKISPE